MHKHAVEKAVLKALDAAAPNEQHWNAGYNAYVNGASLDDILNAAAPDQESWLRGDAVYCAVVTALTEKRSVLDTLRGIGFGDNQYSPGQRRRFGA